MSMRNIAVTGGGASGMMAAIAAARQGASVVILEKNARVGKKLLATGNGRCNFTNVLTQSSHYHGENPGFADSALARFTVQHTLDFFEALGITCKVEENGKVFPRSNQASSVLDVLRHELQELKVQIRCDSEVAALEKSGRHFILSLHDGSHYEADRVILAAGGKASPNLSSAGLGYPLASRLGHGIITPNPALVPLKLNFASLKQIRGIKWDGKASILINKKAAESAEGEILFTEYGISGPPVLNLSRTALEHQRKGEHVEIQVSLVPEMSHQALMESLSARFGRSGNKSLDFALVGFINKQLIPVVLKSAGIPHQDGPATALTKPELQRLAGILQDWRFPVTGFFNWSHAQVTTGGVRTKEIDPKTLQSKLVPGLYFTGEILDIDGDCGGFNLQWAWSSGHVAGSHAAADSHASS
ncbi:MAG: NAD(P)/FAD-dependent oxidoreductase [Candidatus Xenobiia bacterium LiM19]